MNTLSAQFRARPPSRLQRWLREPLLHFLLIGAALFAAYQWLNPTETNDVTSRRIELTSDDLRQLEISWMAQWKRSPTPEELGKLVEERVREEIYYREGLALGLDRDDTIVKRRLAQKMDFLSDNVADLREPTLEELENWYAENGAEFAAPARFTFRHVYFSPDKRGLQTEEAARQALEKINPSDAAQAATLGDQFMFQDYFADSTSDRVANVFGTKFSGALLSLKPGTWNGPVESGLGWHLVWVDSITPKHVPEFEEVELAEIKSRWVSMHRAESKRERFTAMKARYEVVLPSSQATATVAAAPGLVKNP